MATRSRSVLVIGGGIAGPAAGVALRRAGFDVEVCEAPPGVAADGAAVVARFADGSEARGDVLLGCDGLRSAVRHRVLPEAPPPWYTGIVNTAGFARLPPGAVPPGVQHFVFGRRAFFGYIAQPD